MYKQICIESFQDVLSNQERNQGKATSKGGGREAGGEKEEEKENGYREGRAIIKKKSPLFFFSLHSNIIGRYK